MNESVSVTLASLRSIVRATPPARCFSFFPAAQFFIQPRFSRASERASERARGEARTPTGTRSYRTLESRDRASLTP